MITNLDPERVNCPRCGRETVIDPKLYSGTCDYCGDHFVIEWVTLVTTKATIIN